MYKDLFFQLSALNSNKKGVLLCEGNGGQAERASPASRLASPLKFASWGMRVKNKS